MNLLLIVYVTKKRARLFGSNSSLVFLAKILVFVLIEMGTKLGDFAQQPLDFIELFLYKEDFGQLGFILSAFDYGCESEASR